MDWYILAWAVTLAGLLYLSDTPPLLPIWSVWVLRVVAAFRIFDSVSYRLYFIFLKSIWQPWSQATSRRSLAIAFSNFIEVVVAYAILFLLSGHIVDGNGCYLRGALNGLYYSLETITTLGYGDYSPQGWFARLLVILELMTGIMFLAIIIPPLTSLLSEASTRQNEQIRLRAHRLWEQRGKVEGHALDDWLQAEAEIVKRKSKI